MRRQQESTTTHRPKRTTLVALLALALAGLLALPKDLNRPECGQRHGRFVWVGHQPERRAR